MNRLWKWYDALKEPWRFLVLLAIASPLIFLSANWTLFSTPGFIGLAGILLLIGLRIHYKLGNKRRAPF